MAHDALSGPRYGPVHSLCADSLRVVRHGLSQDAELSRCHGAPLSCDGRPDRVPGSLQVLRGIEATGAGGRGGGVGSCSRLDGLAVRDLLVDPDDGRVIGLLDRCHPVGVLCDALMSSPSTSAAKAEGGDATRLHLTSLRQHC